MLQGYRTYITIAAGLILKFLEGIGVLQFSSVQIETVIDAIILIIIAYFRYKAGKK